MKDIITAILLITNSIGYSQIKVKSEKSEIFYHLNQRSFYDSNGDLQGDLNGIKQKRTGVK
jgi:hypothetical protein